MENSAEITLNPGDILYREGDANDCVYVIESGEVILSNRKTGQRIDCERRGAGAILGELSIMTNRPRAVTVEALTKCRIFRMSSEHILARFAKLDPLLRACVETSISFSATFTAQLMRKDPRAPLAESCLSNAGDVVRQLKLESDVMAGLQRGEFSLVYRPVVRLTDDTVAGVDAFMRWDHPEMGSIEVEQFILLAEKMESVGRLTEHAISETCAALARLRGQLKSDTGFYVSVNISGQDVCRDGFVDFVALNLDHHAVPPGALRLEVAETALIQKPEIAEQNLMRLRQLGCGISIDNFGTGYSNLSYLKTLPLTALKIDQAFAGDAHSNAVSRSIVRMLIGLGAELDIEIIAEGLETAEDARVIGQLGCSFAQGNHFHRPLNEEDLQAVLLGSGTRDQNVA